MVEPKMTEGIKPRRRAAKPDSKAPISLEEPMKRLLTAETRPRMLSGVRSWMMVERMTTEMLSKTPLRNSKKRER